MENLLNNHSINIPDPRLFSTSLTTLCMFDHLSKRI